MAALTASLLEASQGPPPEVAGASGVAAAAAGRAAPKRRWAVAGSAALAMLGLYVAGGLVQASREGRLLQAKQAELDVQGLAQNLTGPLPTVLDVHHVGEDCWIPCDEKAGYCDWCGPGNMCCKENDPLMPEVCERTTGFTQSFHHECRPPVTESTADDAEWLQCVTDTGGTCNIWGCHADRGPTECQRWGLLHYCICQEGYCTNLAGKCVRKANSLVAASLSFRNAQWPDYRMYVTAGGSVAVDNSIAPDDMTAKFNLYEVPTYGDRPSRLMMGSVDSPSYIVTTQHHRNCHQVNDDDGGGGGKGHNTHQECNPYYEVTTRRVTTMSMDNLIKMYSVDWEEPAFMIEAAEYPGRYWYVPHGSWGVAAFHGDPGPQGYWIPDPPMPSSLHLPSLTPVVDLAANHSAGA